MSLGIIGGADGPTAIFVSSPGVNPLVIGAFIGACVAVTLAVILILKNKNKK